jgi:ABC-type transporter Mla subunit MlaD
MRRTIFRLLGILELVVGGVLINLGCQLPSTAEVERSFHSAGRVTDRAGTQAKLLHQQVQGLRRMELQQLSTRLQKQTRAVTTMIRGQSVDFDTVRTMSNALGEVAGGLNNFADTLDPAAVGKLSTGLGEAADFIDEHIIPSARQAADQLDESTASLREDALRLSALLKEAPPDLKSVREVYDSLARFRGGLDKMNALLKVQRLETMRDGFRGLETALTAGATQVERLGSYTYPALYFYAGRPVLQQRPFWPEGDEIAEGMRKAAAGATAAGKEMDSMATDLPQIREALSESSAMVGRVREGLGLALQNQNKVEPLLREIPTHAARLADALPKLGSDLARILRDTQRMKEAATALRQAQQGLDRALSRWPELRKTFARFASILAAAHDQLDHAVEHRDEYEAGMQQTVQLAESFAAILPLVTDQLDNRLDEEEHTLIDLEESLNEVGDALPAYAHTTSRLIQTGRMLAWLVAGIVGLHGCYLMLSVRMGRRYSV